MTPAGKFAARLAREVEAYPVFTVLLLMAHAAFLGFCLGRLT